VATRNASAARTPAAAQWIGKLEELTGRTFPAPSIPLTGSELEQAVDEALDDLYGAEWGRGWEHVAIAARALYTGAGFPLMLPASASGTRPERVSTTRRADEIQAATGCDFKAAVRRAEREEIAAYGAPLHMCDAARAQAEALAELYPGRTFTPVIEPTSVQDLREARTAGIEPATFGSGDRRAMADPAQLRD
jgi:hypothetical protein